MKSRGSFRNPLAANVAQLDGGDLLYRPWPGGTYPVASRIDLFARIEAGASEGVLVTARFFVDSGIVGQGERVYDLTLDAAPGTMDEASLTIDVNTLQVRVRCAFIPATAFAAATRAVVATASIAPLGPVVRSDVE